MRLKKNTQGESCIPQNITPGMEVLNVRDVSKNFGYVKALINVNLTLRAGEIHALVGGNGAGKSTLVNIICGYLKPKNGDLYIYGEKRELKNTKDARFMGIGTVHQNLVLIETLDVASNLFLGRELIKPPPLGWLRVLERKKMKKIATAELKRLRINIPSIDVLVSRLSGGQRQGIVCARALMGNTPIMLMDEPTAALGVKEGGEVMDLIRKCRDEGVAILLISHNMKEVFAMANRITVLRLGEVVAEGVETKSLSEEDVVGLITGAIESYDELEARRLVRAGEKQAEAVGVRVR